MKKILSLLTAFTLTMTANSFAEWQNVSAPLPSYLNVDNCNFRLHVTKWGITWLDMLPSESGRPNLNKVARIRFPVTSNSSVTSLIEPYTYNYNYYSVNTALNDLYSKFFARGTFPLNPYVEAEIGQDGSVTGRLFYQSETTQYPNSLPTVTIELPMGQLSSPSPADTGLFLQADCSKKLMADKLIELEYRIAYPEGF